MLSLTTAQRDLLHLLLHAEMPIGAVALGQQMRLTPRQIHYSLRAVKDWLLQHQVQLRHAPGIGIQIICTPDQRRRMLAVLTSQARIQLVLTPDQRQQLLLVALLSTPHPLTLNQLQQDLAVARATILKDLDAIESWLYAYQLQLARRQHRGCWIEGAEFAKRQALAALLWGDVPFDWPLLEVSASDGIVFALSQDAPLLPIVQQISALVETWDLALAQHQIARAERDLGIRFTDTALVAAALAVALQRQRVQIGHAVVWDAASLIWIAEQTVWPTAQQLSEQLWPDLASSTRTHEAAALALQLLGAARDEPWHNDATPNTPFRSLIDRLLQQIAALYAVPELAQDSLLRDGLQTLILPASVRQRFGMWSPPPAATDTHTERYTVERTVAAQIANQVMHETGLQLPADVLDDVILLLRAAIVRARPERTRHMLVVCPSGIATTQLLVARLKARFPRLGTFEVLPMRELTAERIMHADLIITTVPLKMPHVSSVDVIQVHPMLKPEDIIALTQWMN